MGNNTASVSPAMTAKGKRPGRPPGKPNSDTRRITRALAAAVRDRVPADVVIEYWLAVAAGHGQASIVYEEDGESCEPYVTWPAEGELSATPERKDWAITQLRQAGWGMPAQHHVIEGEIRQHTTTMVGVMDFGTLTPAAVSAIRTALAAPQPAPVAPALPAATEPQPDLNAIDAVKAGGHDAPP